MHQQRLIKFSVLFLILKSAFGGKAKQAASPCRRGVRRACRATGSRAGGCPGPPELPGLPLSAQYVRKRLS